MLNDVPQTDSMSEAAMASLVARFRLSAPKPEAFASVAGSAVADALIALHLSRWVDRIRNALGDRIGPDAVLVRWDGDLEETCIQLAAGRVYNTRGRQRGPGADASIDGVTEEEQAALSRLRASGDATGKTGLPRYVTSIPGPPADAPYLGSSSTSDAFIGKRARLGGGCGCP